MGEISEALRRAREEEEERRARGESARPRGGEFSESLRQAAVEEALDGSGPPHEVVPELGPHMSGLPPEDEAKPDSLEDEALDGLAHPRMTALAPTDGAILVPGHEAMETARHIANRLRSELERREARSLAVVSAVRMEGKSTVACNLAVALASLSQGRSVALVDLDLRKPTIARKLGLSPRRGIEAVLRGEARLDDARISIEHPALDVYPVVRHVNDAHEQLVRPSFADVLRSLHARYGVVVVDTPPVLIVPDAALILRQVEAAVAVARMGVSRARLVTQMLDLLPRERVLGSLLNGGRTSPHSHYYHYSDDAEQDRDPDAAKEERAVVQ